jgi:hypothetical protein
MRAQIVSLVIIAAATPAGAQGFGPLIADHDAQRMAADQAARQREVALTNEITRLESQAQTDRALRDLSDARTGPQIVILPPRPGQPAPHIDPSQFASIPDAALADSNAKVRAAADNRR